MGDGVELDCGIDDVAVVDCNVVVLAVTMRGTNRKARRTGIEIRKDVRLRFLSKACSQLFLRVSYNAVPVAGSAHPAGVIVG